VGINVVRAAGTASKTPAAAGDFAAWVNPHVMAMGRLAARLGGSADRDDIVQEALTAAWRKRTSYDESRGTPRAWLLAIVADQSRKSWRQHRYIALADDANSYTDVTVDFDLERAIGTLARRQRLAVELHYFLDLPIAEVAAVMGCSAGTVKATLSQARARLQRKLGEEFR
jgi:RNA polymerase sigma factor (sigma-70 family)